MTQRTGYLQDQAANRVAAVTVAPVGDRYEGTILLGSTPPDLRQLFEEYEELVEGQVLSRLDDVEGRIAALGLRIVFDEGTEAGVDDLQVYPSTGSVSFLTRDSQVSAGLAGPGRVSTPSGNGPIYPTRAE